MAFFPARNDDWATTARDRPGFVALQLSRRSAKLHALADSLPGHLGVQAIMSPAETYRTKQRTGPLACLLCYGIAGFAALGRYEDRSPEVNTA